MKWITRERVRVDRVASAWLIKNFIDPEAEFIFAPGAEVMTRAQEEQATPFHVPEAELGQREGRTGFDALVARYDLTDPGVQKLAELVRAADRKGSAPEAAGIWAITHGFFLMNLPDQQVLELELPVFDALYRYCQEQASKPS